MIKKLSQGIVERQIQRSFLTEEDRSTYEYAYEILIDKIVNIVVAIAIAAIFQSFFTVAVFLVSYIPLRTYAGGYHARTNGGCAFASAVVLCIVSIGMNNFQAVYYIYLMVIMGIVSSVIIWYLAPVEDLNKPLDELEAKTYRSKARVIWGLEIVISIILCVIGLTYIGLIIVVSQTLLAVMLVVGKINNQIRKATKKGL